MAEAVNQAPFTEAAAAPAGTQPSLQQTMDAVDSGALAAAGAAPGSLTALAGDGDGAQALGAAEGLDLQKQALVNAAVAQVTGISPSQSTTCSVAAAAVSIILSTDHFAATWANLLASNLR